MKTSHTTVSLFEHILTWSLAAKLKGFTFYSECMIRTTVANIVQRQFREVLQQGNVQIDEATGKAHTLYSLRHTAICMRIINSEGRVNIFNLAKNSGTSVDQIERFYARFLPLSKEM